MPSLKKMFSYAASLYLMTAPVSAGVQPPPNPGECRTELKEGLYNEMARFIFLEDGLPDKLGELSLTDVLWGLDIPARHIIQSQTAEKNELFVRSGGVERLPGMTADCVASARAALSNLSTRKPTTISQECEMKLRGGFYQSLRDTIMNTDVGDASILQVSHLLAISNISDVLWALNNPGHNVDHKIGKVIEHVVDWGRNRAHAIR